jgi:hypothetical protein
MTDALARWHAWRQSSTDATSRSGGTPKFVSFKLRGSYTELRLVKNADGSDRTYRTHRRRLTLVRTTDMHLVDIDRPAGVWTLVLNGPRRRVWGFRKPLGTWVPWNQMPGPIAARVKGRP